ncbi:MAG: glycosyltransferase, partial [Candidatus Binatia bacterium]
MKILHVVPSFYPAHVYGGPIESVYALCRHIVRQGCEVRVLTTDANGLDRVLDVETDRETTLAENLRIRYCRRLARHSVSMELLGRLGESVCWADVVHLTAVYSFPTMPTLLACKLFGKPLIWSPRGALQRWHGSKSWSEKPFGNRSVRS